MSPAPENAPFAHCCCDPDQGVYRSQRRFDRLGRLFGDAGLKALGDLRVAVFGLGGVGCFAAEALTRSAVGFLRLVDFDEVCITNSNRQLQALQGTLGQPKAAVLQDRLQRINPEARIESQVQFYNERRSDFLLQPPWPGRDQFDWVVDCIDNFTAKAQLIATCRQRGIRVVSSMGAAGKIDPTRIRIADLADAFACPMARELRKIVRKRHGFPPKGLMGVPVVFSDEKRRWPRELAYDGGAGFHCAYGKKSEEHSADTRAILDGTAAYVTGAFGMACASVVINTVALPLIHEARPAQSLVEQRAEREAQGTE